MNKLYIKNGTIMPASRIVIMNDTVQIINPTEAQILADGWAEYITPEPTAEEKMQSAKDNKLYEIESYDHSEAVNGFKLCGQCVWLDKDTRVGLMNSTQITKAAGKESTTLWLNGTPLTLNCDVAIQMLSALELYALDCFNRTAEHKANVAKLTNIEDVEAYDYTTGYPQQLEFTL